MGEKIIPFPTERIPQPTTPPEESNSLSNESAPNDTDILTDEERRISSFVTALKHDEPVRLTGLTSEMITVGKRVHKILQDPIAEDEERYLLTDDDLENVSPEELAEAEAVGLFWDSLFSGGPVQLPGLTKENIKSAKHLFDLIQETNDTIDDEEPEGPEPTTSA